MVLPGHSASSTSKTVRHDITEMFYNEGGGAESLSFCVMFCPQLFVFLSFSFYFGICLGCLTSISLLGRFGSVAS
jgi:hypothetical protein